MYKVLNHGLCCNNQNKTVNTMYMIIYESHLNVMSESKKIKTTYFIILIVTEIFSSVYALHYRCNYPDELST